MDEQRQRDSFDPMASLLRDWLAGARLREVVHLVYLTKAELSRRGVTFLWSLHQSETQTQQMPCGIGERRDGG
jgi:hypothetical protein